MPSPAIFTSGPSGPFPLHSNSFLNSYFDHSSLQRLDWFKSWPGRLSTSPRGPVSPSSTSMAASVASPLTDNGNFAVDLRRGASEDEIPPPAASILMRMEQLNKSNEEDSRSVSSRKSGSSSSVGGKKENSAPPVDVDEDEDLWSVWGELIRNWESEVKKRPAYIKALVKRGIPQHFRTIAWQLLSNASVSSIHEVYSDYMRGSSVFEKVILRDIPRTYPELEFFADGGRGQQSLFNVIKAYSIHDKEVGYCQGSAFIVGQLLLQMPEEEAFAVIVRLMENYRLRELYKPAMTELGLCMFQLECLVQEQMPDLHAHFNNMGFDTSMYASSWFLTLFTTSLPLDLANRIMDTFLVEGMEYIFCLSMAILQQARIDLLRLDMEGMLKYFQREIRERYENDHELLFSVAEGVQLNAKKMKKLEKDYLAKRTKEQEEAIELRRLRTENRLLRQRIEYLEQESSALADRLIKGQVNLAQEAENCISISHELHKLRDINSDAHRKLEEAYESIKELSSERRVPTSEEGIQVDDTSMIEHIHELQQELIDTHNRQADAENTIRDYKLRVQELELANKRLKEHEPAEGIAGLQEELISVKMREAEASLSIKEMRQRLAELEQQWAKYVHSRAFENAGAQPSPDSAPETPTSQSSPPLAAGARARLAKLTSTILGSASMSVEENGISVRELEDQLMGVRIKEADTLAELKEMRQKVMELETQNHVCSNQLKRQDDELKKLREEAELVKNTKKEIEQTLKMEKQRAIEKESELKEESVMHRLKYSEAMQSISDLKQTIKELELKKAERWTHNQLRGSSVCDMDDVSIGSRNSIGSGDALSTASVEDVSAFAADMTLRVPTDLLLDSLDTNGEPEEGSATETEETRPRPLTAIAPSSLTNHSSPVTL